MLPVASDVATASFGLVVGTRERVSQDVAEAVAEDCFFFSAGAPLYTGPSCRGSRGASLRRGRCRKHEGSVDFW